MRAQARPSARQPPPLHRVGATLRPGWLGVWSSWNPTGAPPGSAAPPLPSVLGHGSLGSRLAQLPVPRRVRGRAAVPAPPSPARRLQAGPTNEPGFTPAWRVGGPVPWPCGGRGTSSGVFSGVFSGGFSGRLARSGVAPACSGRSARSGAAPARSGRSARSGTAPARPGRFFAAEPFFREV